MKIGRSRRVRARYVVLALALLATTPAGADAVRALGSTAARNVAQAVEVARGETDAAETVRPSRPGPKRQRAAARRERQRQRAAAQRRAAATSWRVSKVVDGDTIDVVGRGGASETVRIIGIDTPERGVCGYAEATSTLTVMVAGETVSLSAGAVDDRDRYGRMLRYVDAGDADIGLALIEKGLAVARYDSRDGYGRHPREDGYVAADAAMPNLCSEGGGGVPAAPAPVSAPVAPSGGDAAPAGGVGPPGGGAWPGCNEARAAGAAPVLRDSPGYGSHLDGDNDGVGCE